MLIVLVNRLIYVSGWWFQPTPLKNMSLWKSLGMMKFPTEWKNEHVPNHQPVMSMIHFQYHWILSQKVSDDKIFSKILSGWRMVYIVFRIYLKWLDKQQWLISEKCARTVSLMRRRLIWSDFENLNQVPFWTHHWLMLFVFSHHINVAIHRLKTVVYWEIVDHS